MATITFYTVLMSNLDTTVTDFISTSTAAVAASISSAAYSLVTLYVILWGWATIRGAISEPVGDGIARLVKIMVILAASLNMLYYNGWIVSFLYNTPDALASVITGTPAATSVSFLDTFMGQMFDMSDAYKSLAESGDSFVPDLTLLIMSWAIAFTGLFLTLFGAFLTMLAKVGLGITLAVGPIFIMTSLFESTKRFFDVWLGQAINFILLIVLVGAGLHLINTIIGTWITTNSGAISGSPNFIDALQPIAYSIIGFLILMQLPSIASALGGGATISTLGAMNWAAGKLASGARSARNEVNGTNSYNRQRARRQAQIGRNVRGARAKAVGNAVGNKAQEYGKSAMAIGSAIAMRARRNKISRG
jgi:type IV secretion system protein VirB6